MKLLKAIFHHQDMKFVTECTELKEHNGDTVNIAPPVWNTVLKYPVWLCNAG